MTTTTEKFKKDHGLLLEAGLIAVKQLDPPTAVKLFAASQLLDPKGIAPKVGLGFLALHQLQFKEAIEILSHVIQEDPAHYTAQTLLGIAHILNKEHVDKGVDLIQQAYTKTTDETVKHMAESCLHWVESSIKNET